MHAAATPLRECVYPSVWNDDFRGHDCSAYGLVTGASILPRGHDNFWGNFFIPATGLDAVEGTDGCPLVIADLNQHGGWVANTTVGGQTVWQPHGGPAGWFSETPSRSTHNPGGNQWHWTACHALRPLFPCVGLPTTASTHALRVCSASTVAAATNSESDLDLLSVASSTGATICRTVHTST